MSGQLVGTTLALAVGHYFLATDRRCRWDVARAIAAAQRMGLSVDLDVQCRKGHACCAIESLAVTTEHLWEVLQELGAGKPDRVEPYHESGSSP